MIGLTPRQTEMLSFIAKFMGDAGYPPSYQEMADGIGLASRGRAFELIRELEQRGRIRRLPRQARSLEIVGSSARTVTINASLWPALSRYAASHKIPVDTAASELLREVLETA